DGADFDELEDRHGNRADAEEEDGDHPEAAFLDVFDEAFLAGDDGFGLAHGGVDGEVAVTFGDELSDEGDLLGREDGDLGMHGGSALDDSGGGAVLAGEIGEGSDEGEGAVLDTAAGGDGFAVELGAAEEV